MGVMVTTRYKIVAYSIEVQRYIEDNNNNEEEVYSIWVLSRALSDTITINATCRYYYTSAKGDQ